MSRLSVEAVVVRRAQPLTAPVDEELVILDPRHSRYFGLDGIGHHVWGLLEQPQSVDALCTDLESRFDVSPETCRADVLAFLAELEKAELLDIL